MIRPKPAESDLPIGRQHTPRNGDPAVFPARGNDPALYTDGDDLPGVRYTPTEAADGRDTVPGHAGEAVRAFRRNGKKTDPLGSYTGVPATPGNPVQDADDL